MSFIDTIEIKNFKSIRHQKIEGCKRVNVFIGYPNVGKSNILEALGLFSVTQQSQNERFNLNQICRLKHISDLYFDKNEKNGVSITINDTYNLYFTKRNPYSEFEIRVATKKEGLTVFSTNVGEKYNFQLFSQLTTYDIPKVRYYIFDKYAEHIQKRSSSLSIPNGDNLLDILLGNSDLRKEYAEMLKTYNLKLSLSEDEIMVAKDLNDGTYVAFNHYLVSDTLRRLFFYKAAIETNYNSILLFEEPEAHMFPPYISKFTADVMYDKNSNQFFIATHSPFVLNDFMEDINKDELSIYAIGYINGETTVNRLTDKQINDVYQYGVDLFFNLEEFLKDVVS